jgi:hypothetical protein
VASGGSFALNMEGEGLDNPFDASAYEPGTANVMVYREPSGNREVTLETLQSLQGKEKAASVAIDSFSAPWSSQYPAMPAQTFAGSTEPGGTFDSGVRQSYGVRGSAGAGYEGIVSALQATSSQIYRQPSQSSQQRDMPRTGGFDGCSHSGRGSATGSSQSGKQQPPAEDVSFPKTGSFVATPYDDNGAPAFDYKSRSGPPANYEAMGHRSMHSDGHYGEGSAMRGANSSLAMGAAANGYDSYSAGGIAASSGAGYEVYAGGKGRVPTNNYDYNTGGKGNGMPSTWGGQDYVSSQPPSGAPNYGVPPRGGIAHPTMGDLGMYPPSGLSHTSMGDLGMGGRQAATRTCSHQVEASWPRHMQKAHPLWTSSTLHLHRLHHHHTPHPMLDLHPLHPMLRLLQCPMLHLLQ